MVIPRARSSGALSIWSNGVKSAQPLSAKVLVIAAVSVVLPWSTCPIVPTFTCGLVRSNFALAIFPIPGWLGSFCLRLHFGDNLFRLGLRHLFVVRELHRVHRAPLRHRAQLGRVAEHL